MLMPRPVGRRAWGLGAHVEQETSDAKPTRCHWPRCAARWQLRSRQETRQFGPLPHLRIPPDRRPLATLRHRCLRPFRRWPDKDFFGTAAQSEHVQEGQDVSSPLRACSEPMTARTSGIG